MVAALAVQAISLTGEEKLIAAFQNGPGLAFGG